MQEISNTKNSKVYLVRHTKLNCLRIIKCIPKEAVFYEYGEAEAKLLLRLKHPGIPTVYDLKEDQEYLYIVEEYIRGQSLAEYLLDHKISKEQLRMIAIKLCDVLCYLRDCGPVPILYRDMKPEHVILEGDEVRLIDFGIAKGDDGQREEMICGTQGYMAPELAYSKATEKSDVYSLAKTLEYAWEKSGMNSRRITRLIHQATRECPDERPNLDAFCEAWKQLPEKQKVYGGISKVIAVVGSDRGVGCTHIAISLAVFLRAEGIETYYHNPHEEEDVLENMKRNAHVFREKDSIIYHNKFYGLRTLGETVEQRKPPEGVYVQDCGLDWERAEDADWIVFVLGSSPWKDQRVPEWNSNHVSILCNPASRGTGLKLARANGCRLYGFPLDDDPFLVTTAKKKVLERIRKEVWK